MFWIKLRGISNVAKWRKKGVGYNSGLLRNRACADNLLREKIISLEKIIVYIISIETGATITCIHCIETSSCTRGKSQFSKCLYIVHKNYCRIILLEKDTVYIMVIVLIKLGFNALVNDKIGEHIPEQDQMKEAILRKRKERARQFFKIFFSGIGSASSVNEMIYQAKSFNLLRL
ncbi:hypothetical protein RhiirA5_412562 [Rhizophagus irregularis]|uniref:Uncharacterized protein n=3 Tax=Rhizophagus irregularis TaxID=588596 RepID=A0A2I1E9E3_9GLOM|nr:hypothetical protein GLOIN_2v1480176 [Rhizophagus irregularis DAOM 181602=DAOM 197198]EXX57359.1 hypothetical protein RirG_207880 [Rhizophagus irregularis DAOM 197198w]PKC11842.1 hypothetical protein RhiirA5_412562 [Rhizophagus irregularis]PKC65676.1 hypothetical protein RhiirA1_460738 [Rhizophagus irregularis]PKY18731.1 hypothetical protein RhiirB3_492266 [Rhizophagus irregularis]POG69248.1 hypothetical protein GLOIN_2v1480176 [Rhizophagus irregularis DAOM 181602=DAOM 197198]|eukprot:XP_025176114.1 hypothetical protein GLOIN_2v1480176 [Rhizophagus irregularis DAOM 181602=DAOM 197198]